VEGGFAIEYMELAALGDAVRCEPNSYTHVEKCHRAGATAKEVMNAAGEAVMMGGGPEHPSTTIGGAALEHFERTS